MRVSEFARAIDFHPATVSRVESGARPASKIYLRRAARVLTEQLGRTVTVEELQGSPARAPGRALTPQPPVLDREPVPT